MGTPTLHALHYSPWTQRAVWALEHHEIDFIYREHIPFLGEFALQRRGRAAGVRGRVTVPMLILENEVLSDSWDIICYADRVGRGASLRTDEPEVSEWVSRLEPAYDAARRRVTHRTLKSHNALTEAASAVMPRGLARLSTPVAALGARFIARKYRFDPAASLHPERLVAGLEEIRAALAGGPFLLDSFSAADIVAASLITAVRPHASLELGPATQAVWTDEALVEQFADLVRWRDGLRGRSPSGD